MKVKIVKKVKRSDSLWRFACGDVYIYHQLWEFLRCDSKKWRCMHLLHAMLHCGCWSNIQKLMIGGGMDIMSFLLFTVSILVMFQKSNTWKTHLFFVEEDKYFMNSRTFYQLNELIGFYVDTCGIFWMTDAPEPWSPSSRTGTGYPIQLGCEIY